MYTTLAVNLTISFGPLDWSLEPVRSRKKTARKAIPRLGLVVECQGALLVLDSYIVCKWLNQQLLGCLFSDKLALSRSVIVYSQTNWPYLGLSWRVMSLTTCPTVGTACCAVFKAENVIVSSVCFLLVKNQSRIMAHLRVLGFSVLLFCILYSLESFSSSVWTNPDSMSGGVDTL